MLGSALGGLGGAIGGAIGYATAGSGGKEDFNRIVRLMELLKDPEFDMRSLSPPDQRLVAEMLPQVYSPSIPGAAVTPEDSPEMRAAQVRSLATLENIRDEGMPLQDRLAAQQAQDMALGVQQQGVGSAVEAMRRRGMAGGGDELQARLLGGAQGTQLGADLGRGIAMDAMGRRMSAATGAAGLAGGIRGQDINRRLAAADIINRFNEMVSGRQTEASQYAAGARERAQGYNVSERQRISDENARARYGADLQNLERQNMLRDLFSQRGRERTSMLAGALGERGSFKEARRAEKINRYQSTGQGIGQGVGGILDIGAGGGAFGGGLQDFYGNVYGRRRY